MEIVSWGFAIYVLCVLIVYYCLPHPAQNKWLLLTSYGFYMTWGVTYAILLFLLTLFNWEVVRRLSRVTQYRRRWLAFGVGVDVTVLLLYRLTTSAYSEKIFGAVGTAPFLNLLLPVGLTFYGLQAISVIVDAYRGHFSAQSGFMDFALYLAYFPKLLSGPLERSKSFVAKLGTPRVVDNVLVARGGTLIVIGLVRKIVIADVLIQMFPAYLWRGQASNYASVDLVLWMIVYALVLYNDFAGYTSIVRGVSFLFGIELSPNFNQPFFARTFTEFWSRWHLSLSLWLRDYVYFPLSRALRKKWPNSSHWINVVLPPIITMLVSGVWHGLTISMLVWGGLHGIYQVLERLFFLRWPGSLSAEQPRYRQVLSGCIVFAFTTLTWVPFSLQTLRGGAGAIEFWLAIFWKPHWIISDLWLLLVLIPFGLSVAIDWCQYHWQNETVFLNWPRPLQAFLLSSAVLLICAFATTAATKTFIYQGF
jgi:D-alanyl-lipoteichoic acid acyltransferase DltB (MBOAT superfamily)